MLRFIVVAAVVFISIQLLTPFLYDFWFNNLREDNTAERQVQGDNAFFAWQVMSYIVPGIIILWGFSTAARKRVRDEEIDQF